MCLGDFASATVHVPSLYVAQVDAAGAFRLQESSLGLLSSGAHDLPARQQTLRSAIQWSYDLLNADDQRTFRRLSVFVGGCTLQPALCAIEPTTSLDTLDSLVNKSLLRQIETDGEPRLTMLETIREFGLDKLTRTRALEVACHAHVNYYLSFVEEAESHLTGADQKVWTRRWIVSRIICVLRYTGRWNIVGLNSLSAWLARSSRSGLAAATGARDVVGWKNPWQWTRVEHWHPLSVPRRCTGQAS